MNGQTENHAILHIAYIKNIVYIILSHNKVWTFFWTIGTAQRKHVVFI